MRVTGGIYKGKNIEARKDRSIRPTTGKIREAIFNILNHGRFLKDPDLICDDNPYVLEGRRVFDIFCGSGALGIEALSRGAAHVTFVDRDSLTIDIARNNARQCGIDSEHANFIRSDSTMLPPAIEPYTLGFVDPPYGQNLVLPALKSLKTNGWLGYGAIIVVEHGKPDDFKAPEGFRFLDERRHDNTRITILQYTEK